MSYQPIENYGIIGDLSTAALVGLNGSIDFLCFPEFDSPSVFAALLDAKRGGSFHIYPDYQDIKNKQMYFPETNVLLTRFLFTEGVGEITDFMPVEQLKKGQFLIRRVKTIRGQITYKMLCQPRFNYGQSAHQARQLDEYSLLFTSEESKGLKLKLTSTVPMQINKGDGHATFTLKPNEEANFLLEEFKPGASSPFQTKARVENFVSECLSLTINYWKNWMSHCTYNGRWRERVYRSALVLKLLTSHRYGSIIAAPTFSLPERIGGSKNWDYRYTWIRDAAFSIYALIRLGYTKEAGAFMQWVEKLCQDTGQAGHLGLMYSIRGDAKLDERIVAGFEGYRQSSPVRIGNDAYKQLQLDIYGELMDSVYLYDKYGSMISNDFWNAMAGQIDWLCQNWQQEDYAIWEVRVAKKHFLYSRLMCWVAVDRAIRLAAKRSFPLNSNWVQQRNLIYQSIYNDFWNPKLKSFVQYQGSNRVDASTLLMPLVRFISPTDPKWLSTMLCIEDKLGSDSLIFRYRSAKASSSKLYTEEGTFSVCSFWFVECLARSGQLQKARFYFEKILSYANHVGLYSEELGFTGEFLGNFPQSFTHLGLISAAHYLDRALNNQRNQEAISEDPNQAFEKSDFIPFPYL